MNISELFEQLQERFIEDLSGELILEGNCIVWSFDLDRNSDPIEEEIPVNNSDDEEELIFDYGQTFSSDELLLDAYHQDLQLITNFIGELDDYAEWNFSDPEEGDSTISFKIF